MSVRQSGLNCRRGDMGKQSAKIPRKKKATPVGLDARATAHRPLKRAKRPTPVAKGNIEEFENPVNLGKSRKTQLQF